MAVAAAGAGAAGAPIKTRHRGLITIVVMMATIMHALAERQVTAMFVEHDVDIVEQYATRVAAWISGRIAADGPPATVMNDAEVRAVVLGH